MAILTKDSQIQTKDGLTNSAAGGGSVVDVVRPL